MTAVPASVQSLALRFGKSRTVHAVSSPQEAALIYVAFLDSLPRPIRREPLGTVVDTTTGKTAAWISFNGRLWATDFRRGPRVPFLA